MSPLPLADVTLIARRTAMGDAVVALIPVWDLYHWFAVDVPNDVLPPVKQERLYVVSANMAAAYPAELRVSNWRDWQHNLPELRFWQHGNVADVVQNAKNQTGA